MPVNAWRKWLDRTFGLTHTTPIRRSIPLRLEGLEDRCLLSISAVGQATSFIEGTSNPVLVATFTDTTPSPAAGYTASIDWGDGTTDAGTVSLAGGTYSVTGSHTYADETAAGSPNAVIVAIAETVGDMDTATAAATADVAEGDTLTPALPSIRPTEGSRFSGAVATFTDSDTTNVAGNFTASIDWGDGTITAGTVSGGSGKFNVSGIHIWADEDAYRVTVTLSDNAPGTASATATGIINVAEGDVLSQAASQPTVAPTEGASFSGAVAVFSDTGYPDNPPSDFTATIDWGDGTVTAGTVSGGSGSITVSDTHTYAEDGTFNPVVTLTDDAPGTASATATSTAAVSEATISGAVSFAPTEGGFTGEVATFSDPGSPDAAGAFTASIDWGDGTTTTGTVSGSAGSYTVSGSHSYVDEGSETATVAFTETGVGNGTATASGGVTVAEADALTATGGSISGFTEGSNVNAVVALFGDTNTSNAAGDFTASIDWGDGTVTAGTVTGGSGNFTVGGSHSYADEGSFTAIATLTDDAPGTASATATSTVVVAEADTLAPASVQPNATLTEGDATTSGNIAVFSDAGYPTNSPSDFTAAIDWGDGTVTAGTVSSAGDGNFTVSGSHAYADEGSFTATVVIADDAPGTDSATATSTVTVTEADVLTVDPIQPSPTATEGQSFSGRVANFVNTNAANNTPADFTATIDWGDGTTTAGTVSNPAGNIYAVDGTHTYADEGNFTATVVLSDDAPGTASATASNAIAVAEADVLTVNPAQPSLTATEGQSFSGRVANFVNTNAANNTPADFTATIDWGDGTTTAGTVSNPGGNVYAVDGTHTYADEGNFTATVVLSDDAPGTASATAGNAIAVAEGDVLTGTLGTVSATEGTAFSGAVANFSDTDTSNVAADFTATINWGDGTTTAGTVSGGAGSFTVGGSHTYADEGTFTATVVLSDDAPGTATGTASGAVSVADADVLSGTLAALSGTEGTAISGTVATFSDTFTGNTASDFTATIDWGDGTTTAGTVSGGAGSFTVSDSHTYADEGTFTATVVLSDDAPGTATGTASGAISVAEADVLTVDPAQPSLTATEGQSFSGRVANFVNTNAANNTPADFTATIDWGDGTTTAGTVSNPAGNIYAVDGTHTYADEGNFTATVVLSDDAPGTASATASNAIAVAEADVLTVNPAQPSLTATEGQSFSGRVANFVNTNAANNTPADFTATIDWGDGTTTAGTVSNPALTNIYAVDGTHTYADEGNFTATVVLSDDAPGTAGATASNAIAVAEGDTLTGTLAPVNATEGTAFSGTAATFSDTDTANTASDFTAMIDWGDGTTTAGTVSGGAGSFTVSGGHTYADEGTFTATVVLSDDAPGTATGTASGAVSVAEADMLTGTLAAVSASEGTVFSGTVATFSDTFTGNTAADFTATINWGDGSTTAGTVTGGSGSFTVSGSHTYADEGTFTAAVALSDDAPGTASGTASGAVSVADADTLSGTLAALSGAEGTAISGTVATFSDTFTGNTAADFTATINWGDGSTTAGTVTGGSGSFTVSGSHTYTDEGTFTAAVTLSDDAPGTATGTASGTVSVADADVLSGSAAPIQTTEGTVVSGPIATFSDAYTGNTAADFTATINWGDGTTTAGTVTGGAGSLTVSGSHTYTASGSFPVAVTLADDAPGTASQTATTTASVSVVPPPSVSVSVVPPRSVSVAFGPNGEVREVVDSQGNWTETDFTGTHGMGAGGVRFVGVAFAGDGSKVLLVTLADGSLRLFQGGGFVVLAQGGAQSNVQAASVAIAGNTEVLEIVGTGAFLTQFIYTVARSGSLQSLALIGQQQLGGLGVSSASVAFDGNTEVLEVVSSTGVLTQFINGNPQPLGGPGVQSAGVAFNNNSVVLDIIFADGSLDEFDAFGVHRLGMVP